MNARDVRRLLLVQSLEQNASDLWSRDDAAWATAEARRIEGSTAAPERLLRRRALLAEQRLVDRKPALATWLDGWTLPPWLPAMGLAAAFALGLALDFFGGKPRIHILALPLLGLLGWNVVVYAVLGWHALQSMASRHRAGAAPGLRDAVMGGLSRHLSRRSREEPAFLRLAVAWNQAARPLHQARAALVFHALAAWVAFGLLAGLYIRGSFFDYRAGWESTLLGPDTMHALVSLLLGPAAALIGDPLPTPEAFAALRFPASEGEIAAPWIHRIALTIGLVVVLPRLLLAAWAAHRARRLAKALPLDLRAPYFVRLMRELSGAQLVVLLQPHGHTQAGERAAAIERRLAHALGGSVRIVLAANAAYGDDPPAGDEGGQGMPRLLLFNAAATPEDEVQGDYLRRLASASRVAAVLIDETGLRRRSKGPDADARIGQRRRAWSAMLDAIGIPAAFIDLDPGTDEPLEALADALRNAGEGAMA